MNTARSTGPIARDCILRCHLQRSCSPPAPRSSPAQSLWQQRDDYAGLLGVCEAGAEGGRPLADLVNPLVVTECGVLKPIAYDFDPRFDVGSLDGLSIRSLSAYKERGLGGFRALVGETLAGLKERYDLVDWFDHCTRRSSLERTVSRLSFSTATRSP